MLKKLHKLVVKSYIGPLVLTFFIAEFVLIMHFLWLYIGDLVGKGLEWHIIAELLIYASAGLVKMALPLAILLASIMTFGNMGEHFELSAMKSAGISLQKIMKPLIIFSVVLSIGSFFFSNYVIPYTNLKMGSLLYDIGNQRPEMNIKPGIFNNDIPNFSIKIRDKDRETNMMYDFMVYDHRERRGNVEVTMADSGTMEVTGDQKYMIITLYGGKSYVEMKDDKPVKKNRPENHRFFDKQTIIFELEGLDMERTDENLFKHHYQMKRIDELQRSKDSLSISLTNRKKQFVKGLIRTKYFKYERKSANKSDSLFKINDSIHKLTPPEELNIVVNIDSMYLKIKKNEKDRILQMALENAENARKYIESNNNDLYSRKKTINKHDVAWHEKFTLSFACLIFFFIGAPLGAIIRKGGFGLPFLVSIIFFLLYYVVSLMGRKFVEEGVLLPWQGMWISSLLTLPLGILFTYKATTDSVLFDSTAYVQFIKRPFKVLEIQYKDPAAIFHRDVEMLKGEELYNRIVELRTDARRNVKLIEKGSNSVKKLLRRHFTADLSSLKSFIEKYDLLYALLAVQYRDNKFFAVSLEKFPKIELEKYQLTRNKRLANYFLLSLGIFPVGLLVLFRSFLKQNVLKQKVIMVEEGLLSFEEQVKNIKEQKSIDIKLEPQKLLKKKTVEKAAYKFDYSEKEKVSDEEILQSISVLNEELNNSLNYLRGQISNFYGFLRLLFTRELEQIEKTLLKQLEVRRLIRKKYENNIVVNEALKKLSWLNFDKYRMNGVKIFVNYILLGLLPFPLGILIFLLGYNKLKKLLVELEYSQSGVIEIAELIKNKKYNIPKEEDKLHKILADSEVDIQLISKNLVLQLLEKSKEDTLKLENYIRKSRKNIFEFLYLVLSSEFNDNVNGFIDYYNRINMILRTKYADEINTNQALSKYLEIKYRRFKRNKLTIFLNYLFLTIFPIGSIFFIYSGFRLKTFENKLKVNAELAQNLLIKL